TCFSFHQQTDNPLSSPNLLSGHSHWYQDKWYLPGGSMVEGPHQDYPAIRSSLCHSYPALPSCEVFFHPIFLLVQPDEPGPAPPGILDPDCPEIKLPCCLPG